MKCQRCQGSLIVLETFCTDAYRESIIIMDYLQPEGPRPIAEEKTLNWFRDIKQRCVCSECGKEQDVLVDTVKQDKRFK